MSADKQELDQDDRITKFKKEEEAKLDQKVAAFKAKLEREEKVEETLKVVKDEKDDELKKEILASIIPWIIENSSLVSSEDATNLAKTFAKNSKKGKTSGKRPTYYLVDIIALKAEAEEFCNELLKDKDVLLLEEDNNFAVVYNKAFSGNVRNIATALNTTAGDLFRKHSNANKQLEVNHGLDVSKFKKTEFDSYTYAPTKK
ncbi:conserved hypothetical protein [Vibrio crassostreae]|uniref:hypothetical protein n=1 Tax=Vibrio crassostreae TaxID=246167 RepID=UPI00104E7591|nr:hypothetical protein [Vibrio crassostreae]TCT63782.1 hypothetical protein EDB40_101274 [Vibrio crassostreae]CAK2018982.1 conserved hypothetical protein [Vibrio crassostreae]CAK2071312.1 conserved hypothetical protein [Vibrio crassostreae]CAK2090829.1 conserved hypothetical protein [Vibrio crassostreae]CAK2148701.1 conserved hypothetical protein [Vibrio crassostreae]